MEVDPAKGDRDMRSLGPFTNTKEYTSYLIQSLETLDRFAVFDTSSEAFTKVGGWV